MNKLAAPLANQTQSQDFLAIKVDKRLHTIAYSEIIYCSATGDYVKVHTPQQVLITHDALKNLAELLPSDKFVRIHKSYVIAINRIRYIEGNRVCMGDEFLPIGKTYKENLLQILGL